MAKPGRKKGGANLDAAMSFEDIAKKLGVSLGSVQQDYRRALKKLAADREAIQLIRQCADYHRALRARSAECRPEYRT